MEQPTTKRWNKRLVLFAATGGEEDVDRTLMAAWSVRQKHPDAPIGVVTDNPTHKLWRTGLFNLVISSRDQPGANLADCTRIAMKREVFDRAIIMDSHCRLRAPSILPMIDLLKETPVSLAAARTDAGVRLSGLLFAIERSDEAMGFLDAWSGSLDHADGDLTGGLNHLINAGTLKDSVRFGALGETWIPEVARPDSPLPAIELRRGNKRRLHAEMLTFAMHRLVSSDMKRAATIYARVALDSRPDLPQLGAERLVEHMKTAFQEKVPGMSGGNREQLAALLAHAAKEDPAGNLLGVSALHLEMGQARTALAVLRMIYRMKFAKPVPVPE